MLSRDNVRDLWERLVPEDARETVTLRSRQAGGFQSEFSDYTVEQVRLKRLGKQDLDLVDARLAHRYRVGLLWQELLDAAGAPDPKPRDQIVSAAGVTYSVDRILEHKLMGQAWNLLLLQNV